MEQAKTTEPHAQALINAPASTQSPEKGRARPKPQDKFNPQLAPEIAYHSEGPPSLSCRASM